MEYAAVKQIRDTLAETAEKTFFGNLTGTAGLWDKVLRAYEKDSRASRFIVTTQKVLDRTASLLTIQLVSLQPS